MDKKIIIKKLILVLNHKVLTFHQSEKSVIIFFSIYRELVEGKKKKASTKEKVGWQKDWVWTYWCKICLGPYIVLSNAALKAWKVSTVV